MIKTLESELEIRKENDRLPFFTPTGAQKKFIDLVGLPNSMVSIFSAANASGKTALIANLLGNIIFGSQNENFDFPIFKKWTYPKRIRFITDPKLTEEVGPFHSEVVKWWPKGRYEAIKAGKQYFSQYEANGFIVDVMSYDQDLRQFEGATLGAVIFDEPPPRSIWHASVARLRLGGLLMIFMTPLTSAAWVYDELVPNHQDHIVYAAMEDSCITHGINGYLEHDRIINMIKEMDIDEVEARAYGKAMYLKGLIFKQFDPKAHIASKPIDVPQGSVVMQVVDPHIDKPFAMIWGFYDTDGTFYQFAEWPDEDFTKMHGCNLGIQDYKRIINMKEQGWNVKKRIMDRHFCETRSLYTNRTLREDFAGVSLIYEPSYTGKEEVDSGILKIRSFLNYNVQKPIDNLNRPKYIVSPTCKNTIKGFSRWSFDTKTGNPKDEYKDFMDCVRYALMAGKPNSYTPPEPEYKRMYT